MSEDSIDAEIYGVSTCIRKLLKKGEETKISFCSKEYIIMLNLRMTCTIPHVIAILMAEELWLQ